MIKQKQAFTLVELIVVITILAILATISFISFSGFSMDSRNSARASDSKTIEKSLSVFHARNNYYPDPTDYTELTYSGTTVIYQGIFGEDTRRVAGNISDVPVDPLLNEEYVYSVNSSKNEYELLTIYEGEIVQNGIINSSYANDSYKPKVRGTYNKLYVKTGNYYIPLPSLITSGELNIGGQVSLVGLTDSFVITNGDNIPAMGTKISSQTGQLALPNFAVYSGSVETISDKENLANTIINSFSGVTELSSIDTYSNLLNSTNTTDKVNFVDNVVLKTVSTSASLNPCGTTSSGGSKDFFDTDQVSFGQSCDTHKKTFSCDNGTWKEGASNADTVTYSHESCTVLGDSNPPSGGSFTIAEGSSTNNTSINLNITCPTDAEGSNPVEMYVSGDIDGTPAWESCSSSKAVTLTTGNGVKTINIDFRDSLGNATGNISNNITLSVVTNKIIFATSGTWTGNLGGLSGADSKCQNEATLAGLSGTFKAWLSSSTVSASSRLTHSSIPYVKFDGTNYITVANNWSDLTDGTLLSGIDKDANGNNVGGQVWTNTSISGLSEGGHCSDWTAASSGSHDGSCGVAGNTSGVWTTYGSNVAYCHENKPIYCIEQ